MYQSVKVDDSGRINRSRPKKSKRYQNKHQPENSSDEIMFSEMQKKNPKSSGLGFWALGVYKGARIMKAGVKEKHVSLNHMEILKESPKLPIDHRCHPAIKK